MYKKCIRLGNAGDMIKNHQWCETMASKEYERVSNWGMHRSRRHDYETASPCMYVGLPQSLLTPVLVKWATSHGWVVRWDTNFVGFKKEEG